MLSYTNIVPIRLIGLVKVQFETGRNKRARIINTKRNRKRFLLIIIMILEVTQTCIGIEKSSIKSLNTYRMIHSVKSIVPFTDRIIKYRLESSAIWTSPPFNNVRISNNSYSINRNFFVDIRINLQTITGYHRTISRCGWISACPGGKRVEQIPRIHIPHGIPLRI